MMKPILPLMILSVALAACDGKPKPTTPTPSTASQPATSVNPYPNLVLNSKDIAPVKLDYTPTQPETIYYDEQGKISPKAIPNGYYRQIIGKTTDGRTVAQDFYQHNKAAQTSPFVIKANGDAKTFSQSVLDSRVIWYDAGGNVNSVAEFQSGVQQGWLDVYEFNQLICQLKDTENGMHLRFFSPDEKLWGDAHLHQNLNTGKIALAQLTFFHPNGQILSQVQVNELGEPTGVKTFDTQGQTVDAAQNARSNEIMLRRFALLMNKLPQLMAR